MDPIACPVDIAVPNALEAKQNIVLQMRPCLLQLISKPDCCRRSPTLYRSKRPLIFRPFFGGHKLDPVTRLDDPICKPFQVRLSTTAPRITAANENDPNFLCHPQRSRGIPSHSLAGHTTGF